MYETAKLFNRRLSNCLKDKNWCIGEAGRQGYFSRHWEKRSHVSIHSEDSCHFPVIGKGWVMLPSIGKRGVFFPVIGISLRAWRSLCFQPCILSPFSWFPPSTPRCRPEWHILSTYYYFFQFFYPPAVTPPPPPTVKEQAINKRTMKLCVIW